MFVNFTKKILNYIFGSEHPIAVSEVIKKAKNEWKKNTVFIYIVSGEKWFPRVIGKNGQTINLIENLLKIKGYLEKYQVVAKVEK